jgi:hypothetical protein
MGAVIWLVMGLLRGASFEAPGLLLELDDHAHPIRFEVAGRACLTPGAGAAVAVKVGGQWVEPAAVGQAGHEVWVQFAAPAGTMRLRKTKGEGWVRVDVVGVEGLEGAEALRLLSVPTSLPKAAPRLGLLRGAPGPYVAVLALSLPTHCWSGGEPPALHAETEAKFGLQRGSFAMVAAASAEQFLERVRRLEAAAGLPDGVGIKRAEANRPSYLLVSDLSEDNVERAIRIARTAGLGDIWISNYNWASSVGHYPINEHFFPHGLAGLKATVAKLHAAGLRAGMHLWASKISPHDPYITPVPDRRLYKDRVATLAEQVGVVERVLRTQEDLRDWPGEQTVPEGTSADLYRILLVDEEWIRYKRLLDDGHGVTGCERGALGSRPAPHRRGAQVCHILFDPCIRGFVVDQDTDLHDEMAQRIAEIWNAVGFDCLYYDGVEDCQPPHWYYVPKFQLNVWRRLVRKPVVCQGTFWEHFSWHIHSRGGTIDYIWDDQLKEVRERALPYNLWQAEHFMPGELGWFAWRLPGPGRAGTQFDAVEALCAKAAGYDMAFSLAGRLADFEAHPYAQELLEVVGAWERLRLQRRVPASLVASLRDPSRQFTLLRRQGKWEICPVEPLAMGAESGGEEGGGGKDWRAYIVFSGKQLGVCYWHTWGGRGEVRVPLAALRPAATAIVEDWQGRKLAARIEGADLVLPLEGRVFAWLPGAQLEGLKRAFGAARVTLTAGELVVVRAAQDAQKLVGALRRGSESGLPTAGALSGDFLVYEGSLAGPDLPEAWAEYEVDLPRGGQWYVWARLRFPVAGGFSFAFVPEGEVPSRDMRYVLGNSALGGTHWHWDSASAGDAAPLGSQLSTWAFPAGKLRFRLYPREGPGELRTNPQLDLLVFVQNPAWHPEDDQIAPLLRR